MWGYFTFGIDTRSRAAFHPTRISIVYHASQIDSFAWKVSLLFQKNNSTVSRFASPCLPNKAILDSHLNTKYLPHPGKKNISRHIYAALYIFLLYVVSFYFFFNAIRSNNSLARTR